MGRCAGGGRRDAVLLWGGRRPGIGPADRGGRIGASQRELRGGGTAFFVGSVELISIEEGKKRTRKQK